MPLTREKLALIHIVKKELALPDDVYRTILRNVAGVSTSKDLTEAGFRKLMNYLVRDKSYRLPPGGMTLKQKLFIGHLVEELGWDQEHLRNFVHKYYHKSSLTALTRKEAVKLIESLKNVRLHSKGEPS